MKFLPYERLTYRTSLSKEEIHQKMLAQVGARSFLASDQTKPYQGTVNDSGFKINRVINYRNSFLPVLVARIEPDEEGNIIHVKMRLAHFVLGFMMIWMGGVSIAVLGFTGAMFNKKEFFPAGLIPYGMLVFGYLLTTLPFKLESKKYKAFLEELLELSLVDPPKSKPERSGRYRKS